MKQRFYVVLVLLAVLALGSSVVFAQCDDIEFCSYVAGAHTLAQGSSVEYLGACQFALTSGPVQGDGDTYVGFMTDRAFRITAVSDVVGLTASTAGYWADGSWLHDADKVAQLMSLDINSWFASDAEGDPFSMVVTIAPAAGELNPDDCLAGLRLSTSDYLSMSVNALVSQLHLGIVIAAGAVVGLGMYLLRRTRKASR